MFRCRLTNLLKICISLPTDLPTNYDLCNFYNYTLMPCIHYVISYFLRSDEGEVSTKAHIKKYKSYFYGATTFLCVFFTFYFCFHP